MHAKKRKEMRNRYIVASLILIGLVGIAWLGNSYLNSRSANEALVETEIALKKENKELGKTLEEKNELLRNAANQKEILIKESTSLREAYDSSTYKLQKVSSQLTTVRYSKNTSDQRIKELEREISQLASDTAQLNKQIRSLNQSMNAIASQNIANQDQATNENLSETETSNPREKKENTEEIEKEENKAETSKQSPSSPKQLFYIEEGARNKAILEAIADDELLVKQYKDGFYGSEDLDVLVKDYNTRKVSPKIPGEIIVFRRRKGEYDKSIAVSVDDEVHRFTINKIDTIKVDDIYNVKLCLANKKSCKKRAFSKHRSNYIQVIGRKRDGSTHVKVVDGDYGKFFSKHVEYLYNKEN